MRIDYTKREVIDNIVANYYAVIYNNGYSADISGRFKMLSQIMLVFWLMDID